MEQNEKDKEPTPATHTDEATESAAQTSGQEPGSSLPKTQQELDALIEKRLTRERRRLARQQGAQPTAMPPDEAAPAPAADTAALATATRELLIAHAQLDAYRSGVAPAAVEDAVLLAVLQAEKAGEADEDGVRDALADVLKRHPEWKPDRKDAKPGGFKVGVDPGTGQNSAGKKPLPSGRVIF